MTTNKETCRILTHLLASHGVERCVVSPGSRDVPLIIAAARDKRLQCEVVIDERVAAFMALGMASASGRPVALICTSGTAMLNYAPAVAEAYYRRVPLIVVSADRPPQWIDQDDSQTIRQPNALGQLVKRSYNLRAECRDKADTWWVNREINDAMTLALAYPRGPVHINIPIDEPLCGLTEQPLSAIGTRSIATIAPEPRLTANEARWMATELSAPRKVLIVAGFGNPDPAMDRAFATLAKQPNVAIMTESIANIRAKGLIERVDSTLSVMTPEERAALRPDVIISTGGALVSRMVKKFLRDCGTDVEHWYVGVSDLTIDCFQHLTRRIAIPPAVFFSQLANAFPKHPSATDGGVSYREGWLRVALRASESHTRYIDSRPWCDMVAMRRVFDLIPRGWHIQLSNGTPVRYGQLMADSQGCRVDSNRGVSGIDGSTSTAIGASIINESPTLLISGDTSFQYDIGALATRQLSPKIKMIVLCNGGGAIFRFIDSTRDLDELDNYLTVGVNLPLRQLCEGYDIAYFEADSLAKLNREFPRFAAERQRPTLLAIHTDGTLSAQVLTNYFHRADAHI